MYSSTIKSCLLVLAAASSVLAQTDGFDVITAPSTPGSSIPAGTTYTIEWTPSSQAGTVSLILLQGATNTSLELGDSIAQGIESSDGSYDWDIPTSLPYYALYGIKLQLDSNPSIFQYSTYFSITGLSGNSTSNGVNSTTSASTTVTMQVSQVGSTASAGSGSPTSGPNMTYTSYSASASASTAPATSGILPNGTITTRTSASAISSSTSSAASASKSSGAASSAAIGGSSLLGALLVFMGMFL